jgi:hypothetical protein
MDMTAVFSIRIFCASLCVWLVPGFAIAEPISAPEFHSKVVALYSFEPHKLTRAEIDAKSAQLDEFWSLAKANTKDTLPLLRKELEDASNSAFFFYDGSKLLLSLSKDRSDQGLALRAIPKGDLRGIDHTDYLRTVHWLATNGFDTRDAAFRILAFPNFKAFIPQHVLTLGQNYALIYMLFPMDETVFADDLASRLASEREVESQKSLLLALWYTMTPAGHAALKKFAEDEGKPAEATGYARKLILRKAAVNPLGLAAVEPLREERRKVMRRPISDEALIEFDELTAKILGKL